MKDDSLDSIDVLVSESRRIRISSGCDSLYRKIWDGFILVLTDEIIRIEAVKNRGIFAQNIPHELFVWYDIGYRALAGTRGGTAGVLEMSSIIASRWIDKEGYN